MQHNLLLINPWIFDFTAYDLWSKPLGLLYIASFLNKNNYSISYIDCLDKYGFGWSPKVKKYGQGNFYREEVIKPDILSNIKRKFCRYGIPEEYFIDQLKKQPVPDAVLVTSMMTYWYLGPKRVVEIIREIYPEVPIILGGIYASLLPEHAQKIVQPDYIITGPGEIKILQLLSKIFGTIGKEDKTPQSIDDYPYPALDLIKNPDYLTIITSRGCPYNCSFCAQNQISMPFAQRSPTSVIEEIKYHYHKFKLRDFAFYDDALFINKHSHIEIILQKIIDSRLPLRFHTPNGLFAKFIDQRLANLMYKANFTTIRLSFETANEERRKDMNSKVSNIDLISAVENLEKAGFQKNKIAAYVMMGLPGQEINEVLESILFINNLGIQVKIASYSPIHGTKDFERAVESETISTDIDPLLTNKSIYPLNQGKNDFEIYDKIRTFCQVLNYAAQKKLKLFSDPEITPELLNILKVKL